MTINNLTGMLSAAAGALMVFTMILSLLGRKSYKEIKTGMTKNEKQNAMFKLMPAGYGLLRLRKPKATAESRIFSLYLKRYNSIPRSKQLYNAYLAGTLGVCILICDLTSLFLVLYSCKTSDAGSILGAAVIGIALMILCVYLSKKKELDREKRRLEEITSELPVVMNKVVILLGSGMPMSKVLEQLGTDPGNGNPFYEELRICRLNILNGTRSAQDALADMQRRCPGRSMSRFASALIRNITKGTEDCDFSLMELAHEMWREKKADSSRRYKKIKNKLFIPTIAVFAALLLVVAAPAFMQLKDF